MHRDKELRTMMKSLPRPSYLTNSNVLFSFPELPLVSHNCVHNKTKRLHYKKAKKEKPIFAILFSFHLSSIKLLSAIKQTKSSILKRTLEATSSRFSSTLEPEVKESALVLVVS